MLKFIYFLEDKYSEPKGISFIASESVISIASVSGAWMIGNFILQVTQKGW